MNSILPITVCITAIALGISLYMLHQDSEMPELDYQKWWGVGTKPDKDDTSIRSFKIEFNNTVIQDLKERLKNRRPFTKPLEGINSEYGMNTDYLNQVLNYWEKEYDFDKRAELLNRFPHYKTKIQGLDLHFIRVKPEVQNGIQVLPLLMLHGWPSSSKEFDKVIPMLTSKRNGYDFVFEIIAVDLPGYGFSEGSNKPGLNPVQIAIVMRNLMLRLGIEKFYIQAGDWGAQTATHMATLFPEQILGFHTNMPLSSRIISNIKYLLTGLYDSLIDIIDGNKDFAIKRGLRVYLRESGYFHIQSTKPDTIGVALTDSPAGLAAYLMEKLAVCSNRDQLDTPHGGLDNLELDDVLDTVTIVWVNNCIVTSMRLYAEGFAWPETKTVHNIRTPVPTAAINFKYEVGYHSEWILKDKFPNLVRATTLDFGGHFAALQTPKVLVDDVFASVEQFIKFNIKNKRS